VTPKLAHYPVHFYLFVASPKKREQREVSGILLLAFCWEECLLLLEDAGSLSITLAAPALPKDQPCTEKLHSSNCGLQISRIFAEAGLLSSHIIR
jgi:hypothetical protein